MRSEDTCEHKSEVAGAPDYSVHEQVYAKLRASGQKGWGASAFQEREKGWAEALDILLAVPRFPLPGAKVLEVGCGTGVVSRILARRGYQVSGVDISVTAVKWARELALEEGLEIEFAQGNVCDLAIFDSSSFDVVIDGACFHCIIGGDRKKFLGEMNRVLKPGGLFFVSSMIGDPYASALEAPNAIEFDRRLRCQMRNDVPYRFMAEKNALFQELREAGFEVVSERVKQNPMWDHLYALAVKQTEQGDMP